MITSICQMRLRVGRRQIAGQEELGFEPGICGSAKPMP